MDKYAAYVWASYGLTFVVVGICVWQSYRRHNSVMNDIKRRLRAMESES